MFQDNFLLYLDVEDVGIPLMLHNSFYDKEKEILQSSS